CPGKFLLLMTDEGDDTGQELNSKETEVVESGDISILNSLIGHGSPRSLQLWGTIGDFGYARVIYGSGPLCITNERTRCGAGYPVAAKTREGHSRLCSTNKGLYSLGYYIFLKRRRIVAHEADQFASNASLVGR
ncbi:hypothetical protein Tco_0219949, partial [Tanacetum coccineum]